MLLKQVSEIAPLREVCMKRNANACMVQFDDASIYTLSLWQKTTGHKQKTVDTTKA